jgi:RNA-directed DNA polymerase
MGKDGSVSVNEGRAMSEDASGNPGAVGWPDESVAYFAVRRMQTKLHSWAGADASRRFDDLFNLVYDRAFLMHAWEQVSGNAGARTAGVDRATVAWIETHVGVVAFLDGIRESLRSGEFRPVEVRQVMIPKGQSGKLRKLGIPTVADRVVQTALKAVLEPIFEADFLPCSYGFRPNRSAHDAIAEVHHFASRPCEYHWVLEVDIAACFDEIGHTPLLDRLRRRVKDKRVCALVKAFLKAGVLTCRGEREETVAGAPQGGPLSPLMANIVLSALDEHFDRQRRDLMGTAYQRSKRMKMDLGNWRLIRYCDDFVVMVRGERRHAEELQEEVAAVLAPLGLRLALGKTRVVHIDEGFDFLGYHIRRQRKRGTSKYYVYTKPSKKAIQTIKDKVKVKTFRATRNQDLSALITQLNRLLVGWARYFRYGTSRAVFKAVDHHAWGRLMRWIRAKYAGKHRLGMKELRRRFCDKGWRFAHNGVVFTGASSVTVTRYRYRGTRIPAPWAVDPAVAATG